MKKATKVVKKLLPKKGLIKCHFTKRIRASQESKIPNELTYLPKITMKSLNL